MLARNHPRHTALFDRFAASPQGHHTYRVSAYGLRHGLNGNKLGQRVFGNQVVEILGELSVSVGVHWREVNSVNLSKVVLK